MVKRIAIWSIAEDDNKEDNIIKIKEMFVALSEKIHGLISCEFGENFNYLSEYDFIFMVVLKSPSDLKQLERNPAYIKIKEFIKAIEINSVIVDFEADILKENVVKTAPILTQTSVQPAVLPVNTVSKTPTVVKSEQKSTVPPSPTMGVVWKCPTCGKENLDIVGMCGCGQRKDDPTPRKIEETVTSIYQPKIEEVPVETPPKATLKDIIADVRAEQEAKIDVEAEQRRKNEENLHNQSMSASWKCPDCGKVHPEFVGMCGCGKVKADIPIEELEIIDNSKPIEEVVEEPPKTTLKDIIADVRAEQEAKIDVEAEQRRKNEEELHNQSMSASWKCPDCGKVHPEFVGMCGCGKVKADIPIEELEIIDNSKPIEEVVEEPPKTTLKDIIADVRAEQEAKIDVEAEQRRKNEENLHNQSMSASWKCPDCGKVHPEFVGMCGCGKVKADIPTEELEIIDNSKPIEEVVEEPPKTTLKDIIADVRAEQEAKIDIEAQKRRETQEALHRKAMAESWTCKNCGKVHPDYVGMCGCGQSKPVSETEMTTINVNSEPNVDEKAESDKVVVTEPIYDKTEDKPKVEEPVVESKVETKTEEKPVNDRFARFAVTEPIYDKTEDKPKAEEPVVESKAETKTEEKPVNDRFARFAVTEPIYDKTEDKPKTEEPVVESKVETKTEEKPVNDRFARFAVTEPIYDKTEDKPKAEEPVVESKAETKTEEKPVNDRFARFAVTEPIYDKTEDKPKTEEPVVESKAETKTEEKPVNDRFARFAVTEPIYDKTEDKPKEEPVVESKAEIKTEEKPVNDRFARFAVTEPVYEKSEGTEVPSISEPKKPLKDKPSLLPKKKAKAEENNVVAEGTWKCPTCGKINIDIVGMCGCGQSKDDPIAKDFSEIKRKREEEQRIADEARKKESVNYVAPAPKSTTLKDIIADVKAEQETKIDIEAKKRMEAQKALHSKSMSKSWKCPNCGKIHPEFVGMCGCGKSKDDIPLDELIIVDNTVKDTPEIAPMPKQSLKEIIADVKAEQKLKEDIENKKKLDAQKALHERSMSFSWKCPDCGKIHPEFVGMCGCGKKKDDIPPDELIIVNNQETIRQPEPAPAPAPQAPQRVAKAKTNNNSKKAGVIVAPEPMENSWICPTCGRENADVVGMCGCGQRKDDKEKHELKPVSTELFKPRKNDYENIEPLPKQTLKEIIADVKAEIMEKSKVVVNTKLEEQLVLHEVAMANSWKCPDCGKVHCEFVGMCGCGKLKSDIDARDLILVNQSHTRHCVEIVFDKQGTMNPDDLVAKNSACEKCFKSHPEYSQLCGYIQLKKDYEHYTAKNLGSYDEPDKIIISELDPENAIRRNVPKTIVNDEVTKEKLTVEETKVTQKPAEKVSVAETPIEKPIENVQVAEKNSEKTPIAETPIVQKPVVDETAEHIAKKPTTVKVTRVAKAVTATVEKKPRVITIAEQAKPEKTAPDKVTAKATKVVKTVETAENMAAKTKRTINFGEPVQESTEVAESSEQIPTTRPTRTIKPLKTTTTVTQENIKETTEIESLPTKKLSSTKKLETPSPIFTEPDKEEPVAKPTRASRTLNGSTKTGSTARGGARGSKLPIRQALAESADTEKTYNSSENIEIPVKAIPRKTIKKSTVKSDTEVLDSIEGTSVLDDLNSTSNVVQEDDDDLDFASSQWICDNCKKMNPMFVRVCACGNPRFS